MEKEVKTPFSRTDLTKKDKYSRLKHRIESRVLFFQNQVDFRSTSPYWPDYIENLKDFEALAEQYLKLLEGVGNYFINNKTLGDIDLKERIRRADQAKKDYDWVYKWVNEWPDTEQHIKETIGIEMPEKWNEEQPNIWLLDTMKRSAYISAAEVVKARLMLQTEEAVQKGWFITFTTLTIDNRYKEKVFGKGSDIWRNYYRSIERLVQRKTYGSVRQALKNPKCFHFGAVVEEGDDTGQLHIHAMMFMQQIPDCRDPNMGHKIAYRREINEFTYLWKYGYSQTIAVRFSQSDPWGKLGWVWPVDDKCQPIDETTTIKLAQYMAKYIVKSVNNNKGKDEEIVWRTRTNSRMGKGLITDTLRIMETPRIRALVELNVYPRKIKMYGMKIPSKLIREIALTELIKRYKNNRQSLEALPADTRLKTLLKNGTLKKHNHRSQNSGSILAQIFGGRNTSSIRVNEEWVKATNEIEGQHEGHIALSASGGILTGI